MSYPVEALDACAPEMDAKQSPSPQHNAFNLFCKLAPHSLKGAGRDGFLSLIVTPIKKQNRLKQG